MTAGESRMSQEARSQWQSLRAALAELEAGRLSVADFSACAQGTGALRSALPERFGPVLDELLNRLESSALFTEESCSFSRGELLQSLRLWLDKADERLNAA